MSLKQISTCLTAVIPRARALGASAGDSLKPCLVLLCKMPCPLPTLTTSKGESMPLDTSKHTEKQGQYSNLCIPRALRHHQDAIHISSLLPPAKRHCGGDRKRETWNLDREFQHCFFILLNFFTVLQSKQSTVFQRYD